MKCFKTNDSDVLNYYVRSFRGLLANDERYWLNKTKYSFNLEDDMLFSCLYNLQTCNPHNFTYFWSHVFGNCYTFSDGIKLQPLQATGTGSFLGLILEILVCMKLSF